MFKMYSFVVLCMISIGLAGCTNADKARGDINQEADGNNNEIAASDEEDTEKQPESSNGFHEAVSAETKEKADHPSMKPEKAEKIIEKTVKKIHATMAKEQEAHNWFMLEEKDPKSFSSELSRIKQPLSKMIAADYIDEEAHELLDAYTCYCDSYFLFDEQDTHAGLTIHKQTDDYFTASTITLDDGFYGSGWTNEWEFKKENGIWKLSGYDYIFADERPLDITFEQIEDAFYDPETKESQDVNFIEYIQVDGERHIVIQMPDGEYEIYNTKTGAMNYTAMEQYE